ncbi:DUF4232 domain-containing protein, partial [Streptomyces sp. NPDC046324]|uniref:DUF4232 domain-containing protein n=1 Tax=Streptomyces sp. NPDC046324 TaxID=3154915 RepID=UPI0034027E54
MENLRPGGRGHHRALSATARESGGTDNGKSPITPDGGGRATAAACNDNDLSITTSFWRQDSGQNVLITARNISGKACTLYHYPYVGFGAEIEGPIDVMGSGHRPIAAIGPKEKAYAGVFLFRGSGRTVGGGAVHRLPGPPTRRPRTRRRGGGRMSPAREVRIA